MNQPSLLLSWEREDSHFFWLKKRQYFLFPFLCFKRQEHNGLRGIELQVESGHRERKMSQTMISFQLLAAITAEPPSPFTFLLHEMSSDHICKEINTLHLLKAFFIVIYNRKYCQSFPYVALKQFNSFSKTPRLARNFPVKSINESLLFVIFFQSLIRRKEIVCLLPRNISKYYFQITFLKNFTFGHT